MTKTVSIAIETSCRVGGVALGLGDEMVEAVQFNASARHATQLVGQIGQLLTRVQLTPRELTEVYVSVGPGSFTGLRIGITVARTLAQTTPNVRCVAVPTAEAIAENFRGGDWQHLAVLLSTKSESFHASLFASRPGRLALLGEPTVCTAEQLLTDAPRPLTVIGEALDHCEVAGEDIVRAEADLWAPTAEGVWRVGRAMATAGEFVDYHHLLPFYPRKPEAVRLWEKRQANAD